MASERRARGKEGNINGQELLQYSSVKKWIESLEQTAIRAKFDIRNQNFFFAGFAL